MSAHNPQDLKQMQSLPLEAKIRMSQRRIRDWYDYWDGKVYVSFSGGKDSTVLKHLVENTPGVYDVPSVFVNTGLEYSEIRIFAMSQPNVTVIRPEMRFDQVIKKYGYPVISKEVSNTVSGAKKNIKEGKYSLRLRQLGVQREEYGGLHDSGKHDYEKTVARSKFTQTKWRFLLDADFDVSDKCCYHMKKAPSKKYEKETGRKPLIGTLACESMTREAAWMKKGCNAFDAPRPSSQPMSFWTEQDVLHYLKKYDVPYCSVYGDIVTEDAYGNSYDVPADFLEVLYASGAHPELKTTGCDRTGCVFCMFGCHLEKENKRFQQLSYIDPPKYKYCIGGGEYAEIRIFNFHGDEIKLKHCTREQIEKWADANRDNIRFKIKYSKWQPNKEGLGLGHVLDYIGVDYK